MLIGKWDLRLEKGAVQPDCLLDQENELDGGGGPRVLCILRKGQVFPVGTSFLFPLWEEWKDKHGINWELSRTINYT